VFLGEPLTAVAAVGTAAIVLGGVVLGAQGSQSPRSWSAWVVLLPLAGAAIRGGAPAAGEGGLALWARPLGARPLGCRLSCATILAVNRAIVSSPRSGSRRRGVLWFTAVGACNGAGVLAMYAALARGPVSTVSPLVATYPLFTLVLSALFLRAEKLVPRLLL